MNINNSLPQAVKSGKCFLAQVWINHNSSKDQVTLQWAQGIQNATGVSVLIAKEQGINTHQVVTCLRSMRRVDAIRDGLLVAGQDKREFSDADTVYASDFYGTFIGIQIDENTVKNPLNPSQEPKVNPTTGEVQVDAAGNPIYRHTSLSTSPVNTFVQAANTKVPTAQPAVSGKF